MESNIQAKYQRKDIRWKEFDYTSSCYFFVTVNIHEKQHLLGEIVKGEMRYNAAGQMVFETILQIPIQYKGTEITDMVIMPNHIHFLLYNGGGAYLPNIMRWFKSVTTNLYIHGVKEQGWQPFNKTFWQRNYYDRVIRDQREYENTVRYIQENPQRWAANSCDRLPWNKEGLTRRFAHAVVFLLLLLFVVGCADAQSRGGVHGGDQKAGVHRGDQKAGVHGGTPLRVGAEQLMTAIHTPTESTVDFVQDLRNPNGGGVAVVSNQSSRVGNAHLVDTLLACNINVVKIFCPEHGFRGNAEAGATVASGKDPKTGLPIVSLYGKNKKPTPEQMKGLSFVIFDLQDVGCRFYTYISTLHYVMEACAENNVRCIVLDRPNPNCHYVDGPVLDMKYQSFIGMHPVPIVYGLTIGEYAQMINGEHWIKEQCDLTVVPMQNYRRDSSYVLPVPPSPNLQTPQSILLYPSLCLFEGTNISVGRGTNTPFEIIGCPSFPISCTTSIVRIGDHEVYPVCFKPLYIEGVSENPPFKDRVCWGLNLKLIDVPAKFDLSWLLSMYLYCPDNFFKKTNGFEKLAGTDQLRKQIQQGLSEEEIRASWEPALSHYKQTRKKYLIYPDVEQR